MLPEIIEVNNWFLSKQGFNVPNDWLYACITWVKSEYNESMSLEVLCSYVFDQWLLSDLQDIGFSCLPTDILSSEKFILKNLCCLQINSIFDVSLSLFSQQQKLTGKENENVNISAATQFTQNWNKEIKSNRMLKMKLTDGNIDFSGIEFKPIPALSLNIRPGTKIIVKKGAICRHGVLMLSPNNISVLGGEVEKLVEENDDLFMLQTHMQLNIANCEKFKKQLPCKTFDSTIKSKLKSDIKTKIEFDDYDDDEILICADGVSVKKEVYEPLCSQIQMPLYEAPSLKKPRLDSLDDNDFKDHNNADYYNYKEYRENNHQGINSDYNYLMANDSKNLIYFSTDMDNDDFNILANANKIKNSLNYTTPSPKRLIVEDDINNEKKIPIKTTSLINETKTSSINNASTLTSDDSNETKFVIQDISKQSYAIMTLCDDKAEKLINANEIVNDIHSIISIQNDQTNDGANILSTQQGQAFYDKCIDLFKDDRLDKTSTNKCLKEANLEEPFTYLSRILDNNLSGIYSVKAFVVTILGSLSHNLGAFWYLAVKINDGSRTLDVELSDDVITNIVGMTAMECHQMKLLAAKDLAFRAKLMENLNKIKDCLLNLSSILHIEFRNGSVPRVTNIRTINYQDIQLLCDRIFALKSLKY